MLPRTRRLASTFSRDDDGAPHVTTADDRPSIDYTADPATWLVGPSPEATDDERRDWMLGAQHAVSTDFDLENSRGGAAYREYVADLLKAFAGARHHANVAFLRLRFQGDSPLPVLMELYSRSDLLDIVADPDLRPLVGDTDPGTWFAANLLTPPDEVVGESSCESVGDTGWSRLVYWVQDPRGAVTSLVRHVRLFESTGVVVVLRCGGLDPAATVEALGDLDELAVSIRVGGES